jgi:hypothetical protein
MIKLGCGAVSMLSLIAAALLLWISPGIPESLPVGVDGWMAAWIDLFRNPVAAVALFALCAAFAFAAASVTEILLSLLFSLMTAAFSVLCLLGVLGARNPAVVDTVEGLMK